MRETLERDIPVMEEACEPRLAEIFADQPKMEKQTKQEIIVRCQTHDFICTIRPYTGNIQ